MMAKALAPNPEKRYHRTMTVERALVVCILVILVVWLATRLV
jgi:hypothetical protein